MSHIKKKQVKYKIVKRATRAKIVVQRAGTWQATLTLDGSDYFLTDYAATKKEAAANARELCAALGLKVVKELP